MFGCMQACIRLAGGFGRRCRGALAKEVIEGLSAAVSDHRASCQQAFRSRLFDEVPTKQGSIPWVTWVCGDRVHVKAPVIRRP